MKYDHLFIVAPLGTPAKLFAENIRDVLLPLLLTKFMTTVIHIL